MYKEIRYCLYLWSLSVFLKCIYWNYFYDPFTPFKNFTYWLSLLVLEITYDAPTKGGNLHNVVTHVIWANQMNFKVSLVTHTCNVWRNMLFCISQSVVRHFKHINNSSVSTKHGMRDDIPLSVWVKVHYREWGMVYLKWLGEITL